MFPQFVVSKVLKLVQKMQKGLETQSHIHIKVQPLPERRIPHKRKAEKFSRRSM
jgi:hypothetical protein